MTELSWIPAGVDTSQPNPARIYDYLLGGGHNVAADRRSADALLQLLPEARDGARLNRGFLRRAVLFLLQRGVSQFLDLGSGIPTVGNVHEIVQNAVGTGGVVYVDCEPVAVAHSRLLLDGNPFATVVRADVRDPDTVLREVRRTGVLDFDRPIGLLMVALLHFVPDEQCPLHIIRRFLDELCPGSFLALSHGAHSSDPDVSAAIEHYRRIAAEFTTRGPDEILALFGELELQEPGLVPAQHWRPEHGGEHGSKRTMVLAGVARKP